MKKVCFNIVVAVFILVLLLFQVFVMIDDLVDFVDFVDLFNSGMVCGLDFMLSVLEFICSGFYFVCIENVFNLLVSGFGGGIIYYLMNVGENMGVIVVIFGYVFYESLIEWWGLCFVFWGFVVIMIDINIIYDQFDSCVD